MGPKAFEQSRAMSNERRAAISAFVDAHYQADSQSNETPLCTPGEFWRTLNGRHPCFVEVMPYLGHEQLELNNGEKHYAATRFRQLWEKLPSAVAAQVSAKEYARTLAISLVDRLQDENAEKMNEILVEQMLRDGEIEQKVADEWFMRRHMSEKEADFNTSAATILAREYLLRWRAGQADDKIVDMALALLENAADQGDPQACYMLANEEISPPYHTVEDTDLFMSSRKSFDENYLCKDAEARRRYHNWAARCGHKSSIEIADEMQSHAEDVDSIQRDSWLADLDESLPRINNTIRQYAPKAEAGQPSAQYILAEALIDKHNLLTRAGDPEGDASEVDRAIALLKQAAPHDSRAYYSLVWLEEPDTQHAIDLLRKAAFPPAPQKPDFRALVPLAEKLADAGDIVGGEKMLRLAIQKKAEGEKHVYSPELPLAKLLDEHHIALGTNLSEARELYLNHADRHESWLRVAVMCLRGEGGPQDLDKARECFAQAVKIKHGSPKSRLYAELGYTLGWGGLEACTRGPELLTRLLAMNTFQADDSAPLCVDDVDVLMRLNHEFQLFDNATSNCVSEPRSDHQVDFRYVDAIGYKVRTDYKGLTLALSNFLLRHGGEEVNFEWMRDNHYLDRYSMVANYVLAGISGSGRIPPSYKKRARRYFDQTEKLAQIIDDAIPLGPNHLRAYKFFTWLRHQAHFDLQRLRDHEEDAVREQTHRDMLSYLSHTLSSTLVDGPVTARQAISMIERDLRDNNGKPRAISNIAAMLSTFLLAQQLMQTFRHYIADPDDLRKNWRLDQGGDATIRQVLALSLRQSLSQLMLTGSHLSSLQRLLQAIPIGDIKKSFIDEVIPLEMDEAGTDAVLDWVSKNFRFIRVAIDPVAEIHFGRNRSRFTFFFSAFSELIFNALKYAEGDDPIAIIWGRSDVGGAMFRIENCWSAESTQYSEGSKRGLNFISRMAELLGATFKTQNEGNRFVAEICFPDELLKEAS
jgi:TPR repeat protein